MNSDSAAAVRSWIAHHPRVVVAVTLAVIVFVSAAVRMVLNLNATGPWIFADELIYSELARTAFSGFSIRGVPVSGYGSVYPLIVGPAYWFFDDLVVAYRAAQATNAIVMSLTAIPVFFTARVLVSRRWALIAAAMSVGIPAMTYSSVIMTESAFYPLFALSVYFSITALVTGSVWRQLLVFVTGIACFETRQQGVVVFAAFVFTILIFGLLEIGSAPRGSRVPALTREIRRFAPTWIMLLVGVLAVVALQAARGRPMSGLLGAYAVLTNPSVGNAFRPRATIGVFFQHLAELDLWVGFLPFLALLVLIGFAVGRSATRAMRAYAAGAVAYVTIMAIVVSAFAVFTNIGRIEERNFFYVGFLLLIALVWWVSAGLPRQSRWFVIAAGLTVAVPASLPYASLIGDTAVSDTFGLFLPWALQTAWKDATLTPALVVTIGIGMLIVALLAIPRRAWVVVAVTCAYFVVVGAIVEHRTDRASQGALAQGISGAPNWIDQAVGSGAVVSVVFPGTLEPLKVWENEFFNRSVGPIYSLGAPMPASLPETAVEIDGQGAVRDRAGNPIVAPFVLTDSSVNLDGTIVAEDRPRHMVVLKTNGPLRATQQTLGVTDDGWSTGEFSFIRYRCDGGSVSTIVESDPVLHPEVVTVTPVVNDAVQAAVSVPPSGEVLIRTALVSVDGACSIRYLVSPTAVPAVVFGAPDTRSLGVQVRRITYQAQ
jgi:hypothetical protein